MGIFRSKEPTRATLIQEVADGLLKTHCTPTGFFGQLAFAKGQTPDNALAEWHALMLAGTTYALWTSLGSQEKIFPILDVFQPAFLKSLSPGCREAFLKIANARERDYMMLIAETLKSNDVAMASRLSVLVVQRITGHYDAKMEEEGFPTLDEPDVITATSLWHLVTEHIVSTKKLMDSLQLKAPQIFYGSLV